MLRSVSQISVQQLFSADEKRKLWADLSFQKCNHRYEAAQGEETVALDGASAPRPVHVRCT